MVDSKSGTSMRAPSPVTERRWRAARIAFDNVGDRDTHLRRFASGLARDAHDAAPRLHQEVVARTVLVRTRPETRDRTVDEVRVILPQSFVAEAEPIQGTASPVFDHYVGPGRKLPDPLQSFRVFEVNPDGALVAVDGEEVGRLVTGERRTPVAGVVPALGVLDLKYVGPEVAQHHRRVGARQDPREVENPHAVEGKLRAFFHAASVAWGIRSGQRKPSRRGDVPCEIIRDGWTGS
jgi:hypothetical protein